MTDLSTQDWIRERLDNCHIFAARKTGGDRDGWLKDADYFAKILAALDANADLVEALTDLTVYHDVPKPWDPVLVPLIGQSLAALKKARALT